MDTSTSSMDLSRVGVMAAFDEWDNVLTNFDELLAHYSNSNVNEMSLYNRFNNYSPPTLPKSNHSSPEKEMGESSSLVHQDSIRFSKDSSPGNVLKAFSNNDSTNILNIFVRQIKGIDNENCDDEQLAELFHQFALSKKELLYAKRIRRLTVCYIYKRMQPSYFTFRARDGFSEDKIYRHLEPGLAFQLEIYRLRTFHLELIPTSNLKIHLYLGRIKY